MNATKVTIGQLTVNSTAFSSGQAIPVKHTCDSEDVSPDISWSPGPEDTRSYALVLHDPDASHDWTHWVIFNIPAETQSLPENLTHERALDNGAHQGLNDAKKIGYSGPCPPAGSAHHYYFVVYALDSMLKLNPGATRQELLRTMEGHILAIGHLMGTYGRA